MPYTPPSAPAPLPDASNPYLVAILRSTLGEQGWSFQRLTRAMRWHRQPEWLAGVAELALELGLITVKPKVKLRAEPKVKPAEAFILPVPLRSQSPEPVRIIKEFPAISPDSPVAEPREPAPWIMEGESDEH